MLSHIKDILKKAESRGYAVGAFNIHNFETILGVANAAVKAKSPVIIQVSEGTINYMGLKPVTHIVSTVAKNTAVPIALHLDHGKSLDVVFECIAAGFTSVHIDASHLPLDENIKLTREVVEFSHTKNVWVQGEVGAMVGGHGDIHGKIEIPLAELEDVVSFAKKTKIDTIAAAIGTAHGAYDNESINFPLLKSIKARVDIPFVLHGGSGISDEEIQKAIKMGVNVINIGTDIKVGFCQALIKQCRDNQEETDPRKLLMPAIETVEKIAIAKMELFGSAGKFPLSKVLT